MSEGHSQGIFHHDSSGDHGHQDQERDRGHVGEAEILIGGSTGERLQLCLAGSLGDFGDLRADGLAVVGQGHELGDQGGTGFAAELPQGKGYFVHPTMLTNVSTDARLYREEIFGPVVAVLPFDDEDEAIALANDTTYGLAGAVYTQNGARAHRLAKRIEAGTITLNCQLVFDHQMPFGGYKQSGWGREFGKDGIEMYLQTKSVYNQL
ncbi:aldehyde dehydrogenase family protein [Parafrankia sp. BMG5.11]|nr:aldehyde dehydrogenase family protein [Parafrankia sp. BMG5.11]